MTSNSDQSQVVKVDIDSKLTARSQSDHDETRGRELKALQALISALNASPSPAAAQNSLEVDAVTANDMSRLSMGEGIVTPSIV